MPGMKERRWGRILWMRSQSNIAREAENHIHHLMGDSLSSWINFNAAQFAENNVTINALIPGALSKSNDSRDNPTRIGNPLPLKNRISVQQVVNVIVFLLSKASGGIYGRTIELGDQKP